MLALLIPVVIFAPIALLILVVARAMKRRSQTGVPDRWSISAKVAFALYLVIAVPVVILHMQLAPQGRSLNSTYMPVTEASAWTDAVVGYLIANLIAIPVTLAVYGLMTLVSRMKRPT